MGNKRVMNVKILPILLLGMALLSWNRQDILADPNLPAGDLNQDYKVDALDFAFMAGNWSIDCNITPENPVCVPDSNACGYKLEGDLDADCRVDLQDLAQMAGNWLVDCYQDPTNPSCNGVFSPFTITAVAGDNGSIDPNGAIAADWWQVLNLTATPDMNYGVDTWTVDGNEVQSGGQTFTLSHITADHTVAVSFKSSFTVTTVAGANGSIDPNGDIINDYGQDLVLIATPDPGYAVDKWILDGNEAQTGNDTFILSHITADHTVAVSFKSSFTVTTVAGANGSIDPNGDIINDYGENLILTATPAPGYAVDKWTLDGNEAQTGNGIFILSHITADHTVAVSFKSSFFIVTAVAGDNGSIDPNGAITAGWWQVLNLTATPDTNYGVDTWTVDGNEVQSGGQTFTLSHITADHTVAVSFKSSFTVTTVAGANGSIDPNGDIINDYGQDLVLIATPDPGYAVDKWTLDGNEAQTGLDTFILFNIMTDHTVAVSFKQLPTVTIAASDSNDNDKAIANLICTGTNDDTVINSAILSRSNAGGGTILLLPGTYKIRSKVLFRDNTANIVFRGSGRSTILEKDPIPGTMSGAPVAAGWYSIVTATTGIFTPNMVNQTIQFDTSHITYWIKEYVSATEIRIGDYVNVVKFVDGTNDASGETPGDTFRIADTSSTVYQQRKGHHLKLQDFAIDTKNFGYNRYAGNKGLFINGNPDDYSLCHHIYIERIFSKNSTAEAICIDYAQYGYITDCNTENSAWAGVTLAQVKNGAIQNCHVYNSGTANHTDSLGAGVNCQNVENGLIADNYIDTARDIGLAVATQELQAVRYPSRYVTVRNNTIVNTNNIAATMVILIYRTQGGTPSVRNEYVDIIGNSISGDVGGYHGILVNNSDHVNVLDNMVLGGGSGRYGMYFGNQVDGAYYNGNSESWRYSAGVLVDAAATNVIAGTNYIVP